LKLVQFIKKRGVIQIRFIDTNEIFIRGALIGDNLDYKENVKIEIENGLIENIQNNANPKNVEKEHIFEDKILLPGFINSHTHIGDYGGLDKAWNRSLDEAVGKNGIKYQFMKKSNIQEILQDGLKLLQSLGVFGFVDFREEGLYGARMLNSLIENQSHLEVKIMARPESQDEDEIKNEIFKLVSEGFDIGLNRAFDFTDKTLESIREISANGNRIIGIHLGEEKFLEKKSERKYGQSDFNRTIKILKPNFIVHGTNLSKSQWDTLPKEILPVLCPRSNFYFNTGLSPIKFCLNNKIDIALGTDNFMAIHPSLIEELQYAFVTNRLSNEYNNIIRMIKSITVIPSKFFKFDVGILEIGKKLKANLFDISRNEFKHSSWWNNIIFRANSSHFEPIIVN
jgi:cytosine/adenosine deaminase-related metal-dependent hydrolase